MIIQREKGKKRWINTSNIWTVPSLPQGSWKSELCSPHHTSPQAHIHTHMYRFLRKMTSKSPRSRTHHRQVLICLPTTVNFLSIHTCTQAKKQEKKKWRKETVWFYVTEMHRWKSWHLNDFHDSVSGFCYSGGCSLRQQLAPCEPNHYLVNAVKYTCIVQGTVNFSPLISYIPTKLWQMHMQWQIVSHIFTSSEEWFWKCSTRWSSKTAWR